MSLFRKKRSKMKCIASVLLFLVTVFAFSQEQVTFYFDTNKYELSNAEYDKLHQWITLNTTSKILSITGATDDVGSSGYNDTLSQKRVNYIFDHVKDKVTIREDFKSISLGEKGAVAENKAENRIAIIHFLQEKDLDKEKAILGIQEAVEEVLPENATLEERVKASKVGTKIILKNINFYQNTFATLPESQPALYDLLYVLQTNPSMRIEIQGHICCIDKDYRNLSADRAKQIKRFLVYNGIPQHRIQTKGFGVAQPLYAIPEADEAQAAANRRVEIEILSK